MNCDLRAVGIDTILIVSIVMSVEVKTLFGYGKTGKLLVFTATNVERRVWIND